MKKTKFATLVLSSTVALSTILTGCANNAGNSGTTSGNSSGSNSNTSGGNSTTSGGSTTSGTSSGTTSTPSADIPAVSPDLAFTKGTELRMGTGYNNAQTGLFYDPVVIGTGSGYKQKEVEGDDGKKKKIWVDKDGNEVEASVATGGTITLADGKSYISGDLKPTWVAVQDKLGMKFTNVYQGNSASKEWDYWKEQLDNVDMVSGTASQLNQAGPAGQVVNIAEYLDKMPNFKAYLEANPIVRLSITGDTETGAIYFSPYFDGVNDIERMPLMRTDWVEKLLNGSGDFTAEKSGNTATPAYEPFMPTEGKTEIEVVKKDGSGTEKVTKDFTKNIVKQMNDKGSMTGVEAVNMLRKYIDEAYGGYYGENRADLFIGQNAAWDVDELVALLRCVTSNAQTLNGTDTVQGLFSREDKNNQRRVDMFRFAGTLFGVRGLESRQDYLYIGNDNELHDARQEEDTYKAMEKMNAMVKEGLISKSFVDSSEETSSTMLENDLGFMHYDYNQTQTILNQTKLNGKGKDKDDTGEKYMAVMVPVSRWNDGTGEKFMRFTESWRSVKTDGWAISKAGVGDNQDKLYACLAIIDYAYSKEGQVLMSYGPEAFRSTETFDFNGEQWPKIADKTYEELWAKASGNYTNYARQFLGSTLSFAKSQAFEYQCTHEVGREGAAKISNAIKYNTIKHPELALAENPWYTSVPTTLPNTKEENDQIAQIPELQSNGKFGQSKDQDNVLLKIIVGGYAGADEGTTDAASMAKKVKDDWKGSVYLELKGTAWVYLQDYYKTL